MLCINAIVRKQWTEKERPSYPVAQLPSESADAKEGFLGSRLAWLGFAFAASIALVNGLSFLYPSIPSIPIYRRTIAYLFAEKPLSAMQKDLL